jgi:hypothetical protein
LPARPFSWHGLPRSNGRFSCEAAIRWAAPPGVQPTREVLDAEGDVLHRADDLQGRALEHAPVSHHDLHALHSLLRARQLPESMTGRPSTCSGARRQVSTVAPPSRAMRESIERGERRLVNLIHLARDRVLATAHESGERAEVAQLERGLCPGRRDEARADEEPMVRLAGRERPVDEDARGRATPALGRIHGSTPAAVARGATSKPRRSYARHSTRK